MATRKSNIIYAANSRNHDNNIRDVLEGTLQGMNIRGRDVLIKPNMVDPGIGQACSDPQRLQVVVDVLRGKNAGHIYIGDEPAEYVYHLANIAGAGFDLDDAYRRVGFDRIRGADLLDISTLPDVDYEARTLNPDTSLEELTRIPTKDTSNFLLVSFALPKHHGNFNYSGVIKNLMGLVPPGERQNSFHFNIADVNQFYMFINSYVTTRAGSPEANLLSQLNNDFRDGRINGESLETHARHLLNAGALKGLKEHYERTNLDAIYILDGTYLLSEHEHEGIPIPTDFAIAGQNPYFVDCTGIAKLGINLNQVPYISQMRDTIRSKKCNIEGNIGTNYRGRDLIPKQLFRARNGLNFSRII